MDESSLGPNPIPADVQQEILRAAQAQPVADGVRN